MINLKPVFALVITTVLAVTTRGEQTTVAVATNFTKPMEKLVADFEESTQHKVHLVFGSSGKLFAQIQHGAPFDALLSADTEKPAALVKSGKALADSRFTYAVGTLVLWSSDPDIDAQAMLQIQGYNKLAIANPRLAPYGAAAMEVLEQLGIEKSVESKLVVGENIAQTYQFVASGNAQLGFVALSQVMTDSTPGAGNNWVVPSDLHRPIRQDAVLLKRGENNAATTALLAYLRSQQASTTILKYGYGTGRSWANR